MLDHIGIRVSDLALSRAFYLQALAPLGIVIAMEVSAEMTGDRAHIGFGPVMNGVAKPEFWISEGPPAAGLHVAFTAPDRASIHAFHAAALRAGGRDNGAPGVRPQYHPHYYTAFVLDPDGHNIEAVSHRPD